MSRTVHALEKSEEERYRGDVLYGPKQPGAYSITGLIEALRRANPEDREAFCKEAIAILVDEEDLAAAQKDLQDATAGKSAGELRRLAKLARE
jgi:hypothetical protein